MSFVEIRNLFINYKSFTAVDDLSFNIEKGDIFGFIGPNGAGKTSTIKFLATLLKPFKGSATIDDIDVVKQPFDIRSKIGYVPDSFEGYDDLSVKEYLHFFAAAYELDPGQSPRIITDVLELTDLNQKTDSLIFSLSRGMKQRLSIARILLHDPAFLLLDEPASGLDPRARIEMRELLKELKAMGKTILISSHILSELSELCDSIGIIEKGKMVAQGSLSDIYDQLNIQRKVHIQIANLSNEIIHGIGSIDGVNSVTQEADRLTVEYKESMMTLGELHERVYSLGARIEMFQGQVMDMETAFMKLTTGQVQ